MRAPFIDILEEDTRNLSMLRLFKVICLVCFLLVPLTAFTVEEEAFEDIDYFPADYKCYDTGKQSFLFVFLNLCEPRVIFAFDALLRLFRSI